MWGGEEFDTDNMHSVSANVSNIYIPYAGGYQIKAGIAWTTVSAAGVRGTKIWHHNLVTGGKQLLAKSK